MMLSLIIAIVAIATANNKKIWIYKFTKKHLVAFVFAVIVINYLMAYSFFQGIGWNMPILECSKGIPGKCWAYIISVVVLLYFVYKITLSEHFPISNNDIIIRYYKDLIDSNVVLLYGYLYTYHSVTMPSKKSNSSDEKLLHKVMEEVIADPRFIRHSAEHNPYVFLQYMTSEYSLKIDGNVYGMAMYQYCNSICQYQRMQLYDELYFLSQLDELVVTGKPCGIIQLLFTDTTYRSLSFFMLKMYEISVYEVLHNESIFGEPIANGKYDAYYHSITAQYLLLYKIVARHFIKSNVKTKWTDKIIENSGLERIAEVANSAKRRHVEKTYCDYLLTEISKVLYEITLFCNESKSLYCDNDNVKQKMY